LIALCVVAFTLGGYFWLRRPAEPAPLPKPVAEKSAPAPSAAAAPIAAADKSLIVLPLENLSPDPDNAFFTDGMHNEITLTLSRIPDLRVISRASALAFKGGGVAIADVARKVNVANVMTGSVRRDGNQVRIQLELRRASDEELLWSQTFNKGVGDQLATQTEIANDVARALQLRNTTGTMQWARLFTQNPEAYDRFLKTLELYNTPFGGGAKGLATAEECVRRFEEVLRLDPQFSVATSYLSRAHTNAAGRSADREARARHAGEAKRLAEEFSKALPGGAGDGALANYYSNIENNYERSLTYAQNVVRALPNDAAGYNYLAIALSGLGRFREAEATYRHALAIDPLTTTYSEGLIVALFTLREEVEMEKAIDRYVSLTGSKAGFSRIAWARFIVRAEVPKDLTAVDPRDQLSMLWTTRRFSEALAKCDEVLTGAVSNEFDRARWLAWKCLVLEAMSRNGAELAEAKGSLVALTEKWAQLSPDKSVGVRDSLGGGVRQDMGVGLPENLRSLGAWVFSCLERGEEAVSTSKAAIERWNPKSEPRQFWLSQTDAAAIYARFGRKKEAIALLRHLLSVPSQVTVPLLRASPSWDNLRDDPEFKALLADPKNSAPL
jgi:TolB-like protein